MDVDIDEYPNTLKKTCTPQELVLAVFFFFDK